MWNRKTLYLNGIRLINQRLFCLLFFRRAFHILSYFMFYFNIFIGMVSCLLRILFGLIFGIVFLSRLQKSSLPRSYERRDPGNPEAAIENKQLILKSRKSN